MNCPKCGHKTKVTNSRTTLDNVTNRRRECIECKERFTTYEIQKDDLNFEE